MNNRWRSNWKDLSGWRFRLGVLLTVMLAASVTRSFWLMKIGQSLTCTEQVSRSDVIVVENLDPDYLLFERAASVHKAGFARRVLVPVQVSHESAQWNAAAIRIAELQAQMAQIPAPEIIPIRANEPISLNISYKLRDFLIREHVRSIMVVTSAFRSKRSSLIYDAVMVPAGIAVACVPVFTGAGPQNWSQSWHGIEEVTQQLLKLQFYRFYVLWNIKPAQVPTRADQTN